MREIKTLIFTTERDHEWLKQHEREIRETMDQAKNVKMVKFEYRYADIVEPEKTTDENGKVRISQTWFDNTFTAQARQLGFDTAVFHFTTAKRREWGLNRTINGSYLRDPDDRLEFWVCADKGQKSTYRQIERNMSQYVRVFVHEYAHGFIHWFHPERREDVHTYDYEKKDIKSIFKTIEVKSTEPVVPPVVQPPLEELNIDYRYKMNNYWTGNEPISIVLHTTGGYGVVGAVETLLARGLSYNYIIDNGQIYQLVDWTNSAWHAGVKKSPNLRATTFFGDANPNKKSVGIAFTYPRGNINTLADVDVDAAVRLIKFVGRESGNRYNADNIFAHKEITIDKPEIVLGYRKQVLDGLVGDKDPKDAAEKTRLELIIKLLQLKLKLLLLQGKLK